MKVWTMLEEDDVIVWVEKSIVISEAFTNGI